LLKASLPLQNFKACRETIMDAAQLYVEEKDDAQVRKGGVAATAALATALWSVLSPEYVTKPHDWFWAWNF
jgi:hypothetical protein